jgi:hypothetical protein
VVRADDQCRFREWLRSITDPAVRASEHYGRCEALHRQCHVETAAVLERALAGDRAGASQAIGPQSEFSKLSRALTAAMREWRDSGK